MFRNAVHSIASPGHTLRPALRGALCLGAITGFVAALLVSPTTALAAEGCPAVEETQAFTKFNDANWYVLAPAGDFEGSVSAWTLSGGAAQVSGSETYNATGTAGKRSLALPSGATAQSPYMCVDRSYRTLRFFAIGEEKSASIAVSAVYSTPSGPYVVSVGTVNPGSSWAPSEKLPTYAGPASAESNGTAQVAFRVTSKGKARIDDLYVDPRMR
jgi:hypothetical protein